MSATIEPTHELELRRCLTELHRDIHLITVAYRSARQAGDREEVMILLRKRSELIDRLFRTQKALLQGQSQPDALALGPLC